jgi:RNA polymerase sigma-70 factor (ECF subfamily)
MSQVTDSQTSMNLLETLRREPSEPRAWGEFVQRYRPKIYGWCCAWGLQGADADDVAQNVLAKLTETMRAFRYDPTRSFRAWLKRVTRRALLDFVAGSGRGAGLGDDQAWDVLHSLEARADLARQLAEAFDHELLDAAMARVRNRVAPSSWEAFRLTALEGLTGAEAARRLQVPVANVFMAKHRVRKMLQNEVRMLDSAEGP